jgi:hypothetical protein
MQLGPGTNHINILIYIYIYTYIYENEKGLKYVTPFAYAYSRACKNASYTYCNQRFASLKQITASLFSPLLYHLKHFFRSILILYSSLHVLEHVVA